MGAVDFMLGVLWQAAPPNLQCNSLKRVVLWGRRSSYIYIYIQ
jgi:hypothetical protein